MELNQSVSRPDPREGGKIPLGVASSLSPEVFFPEWENPAQYSGNPADGSNPPSPSITFPPRS